MRAARSGAFWLAGAATLLGGAVLLFGWLLDIEIFRRLPGQAGMAVTAAGGVLAAAALVVRRCWPGAALPRGIESLAACFLLAVAVADLVLLAVNPAAGLDSFLFGFADARAELYMSPATAVCLALAALCLLLPLGRRRFWGDLYGLLVACGLAVTVFALTGYLFDSEGLRQVFVFAAMSPQTAVGFFLVYLALAGAEPARGWMRIVVGAGPGSAALRRLLPFFALGPFVFCWLALIAVDFGYFNTNFRLSVLAIASASGLIALLFWGAQRQNADARDLQQSNRRLRRALAERDVLLREVYHRVKNNLQFVDAMLALEGRDMDAGTVVSRRRMEAIRRRVHALSLVHQQLMGAQDLATLDLGAFLRDLCANLARGTGLDAQTVRIAAEVASLQVNLDQAVPIGLLVTELVSNAIKHAFPDGRTGVIAVEGRLVSGCELLLRVSDDGVGLGDAAESSGNVGSLILQSLVTQLGATMQVEGGDGTEVVLRIPLGRE